MGTLFSLLETKTSEWIKQELENAQSVPGAVIKYVRKTGKLREPQAKAIEVYLWLKFVGQNQKLSEMVKQGLLYDDASAKDYKAYHAFGQNYTTQFLNQFSQDNNLKKLQDMLLDHPLGSSELNWDSVLAELLHNYEYPNFLFSLPMGAGKTFLMAAFIYLDLYFAKLYPKDKRFAHNFVVFAPQASKTAILPSLQTIKNFNPEWVLPPAEATKLKQEIQIEILDSLSSQRKDKLQGNNPNLEKVNRITQTKNFGLVFITNAEKVVLEQYADKDKIYADPNSIFYNPKTVADLQKLNELREKLSQVPYLTVILDEVHHSYGENGNGEKKLRQAVNILNQHGHVVCVLGLSGTPYVKHKVQIGSDEISLNQIQDIVYNFPLNEGIGRFLKIPEIKSVNVKEELFIAQAMDEFFNEFDFTYPSGTKSKLAFYCPSKAVLNEKILPAVQKWYAKHRPGKEDEIFRFYRAEKKDDKEFKLPKDQKRCQEPFYS
jgi:type III restriction enzyme